MSVCLSVPLCKINKKHTLRWGKKHWKACIHHHDHDAFLPHKDFSDTIDGDNNKNYFTVLHNWMCQHFENLHSSVNQYFPNDQWHTKIMHGGHRGAGNQLKYKIYWWILILFLFLFIFILCFHYPLSSLYRLPLPPTLPPMNFTFNNIKNLLIWFHILYSLSYYIISKIRISTITWKTY